MKLGHLLEVGDMLHTGDIRLDTAGKHEPVKGDGGMVTAAHDHFFREAGLDTFPAHVALKGELEKIKALQVNDQGRFKELIDASNALNQRLKDKDERIRELVETRDLLQGLIKNQSPESPAVDLGPDMSQIMAQ